MARGMAITGPAMHGVAGPDAAREFRVRSDLRAAVENKSDLPLKLHRVACGGSCVLIDQTYGGR